MCITQSKKPFKYQRPTNYLTYDNLRNLNDGYGLSHLAPTFSENLPKNNIVFHIFYKSLIFV